MASGTIYGTTSNQYIEAKIEWNSTPNVTENKSTVYADLYYRRTNTGYETYGTPYFSLYIDNVQVNSNANGIKTIGTSWSKVLSAGATVTHNGDGTQSVKIKATGGIYGTTLTSTNCEGTVALDTIPRASTLDSISCSTNYFTGSLTFAYTPKSASFGNRLNISLNIDGTLHIQSSIQLGSASPTQQKYTSVLSDTTLSQIYKLLPNATKGVLRVTLTTYTDYYYRTQVGDAVYKEITLSIPNTADTQPSVSMSVAPSSTLPSPYNGLYIQGLSKVKATIGVETKYNASVVATSITVNGNTYASPYESDILYQEGKVSVKATAKDSRGFYGTNYKDIEVIPYSKPYVSAYSGETSIIAKRCDASANYTDSGTYLKIKAKVVYSKVISGGVQNNYGRLKIRYRNEGGAYSAWQTIHDSKTDSNHSDEVITDKLLNGALNVKTNYQVQIVAFDDLYESEPITIAVPSDAVYMHRPQGGKSMGLGGYSSGDGNLDVYWNIKARDGISLVDAKGNETPFGTTLPLPRDQIKGAWNPDNLECGVYVVSGNCDPLKGLLEGDESGEPKAIMSNGVFIHMVGSVGGNVKIQIALPVDTNRTPMYRICWYSNWAKWRQLKL